MREEQCPQCNKIKSLHVEGDASRSYFFNEWCECPIVKHDGNLDNRKVGDKHALVTIEPYYWAEEQNDLVNIHGGYGDSECFSVYIDAKQALSLLQWLQQEKETLEKLALD